MTAFAPVKGIVETIFPLLCDNNSVTPKINKWIIPLLYLLIPLPWRKIPLALKKSYDIQLVA